MIPFEEIDNRLEALGENRAWLAMKTGRSADSLRTSLAPNAPLSKRTNLLQRALSEAIEREEALRSTKTVLPSRLTLQPASDDAFRAWCRAYKASEFDTMEEWAIDALNDAAYLWKKSLIVPGPIPAPLAALPPAPSAEVPKNA